MRQHSLTALVVLAALAAPTTITAQDPDRDAIVATVDAFHAALVSGDSAGALALLAPDLVVLESGGMETLTDYRAHHLPADIAYARAVTTRRDSITVTRVGDAAWVASTSRTSGTWRERLVNSAGAELMVLGRTASGWRIRAIHWSSRTIRSP